MNAPTSVKKLAVEQWVAHATAGDAELGRGPQNYTCDPAKELQPVLRTLKDHGVTVYVGSGQVLLADLKPANPVVIQRRPLAQRQVKIVMVAEA